jgi:hypothetical protein
VILAAVIIAAWSYLPSKSEWKRCEPERAQQASIEALSKSGGRLTHTLCGRSEAIFCVLIPAHAVTWKYLGQQGSGVMSSRSDTEHSAPFQILVG